MEVGRQRRIVTGRPGSGWNARDSGLRRSGGRFGNRPEVQLQESATIITVRDVPARGPAGTLSGFQANFMNF